MTYDMRTIGLPRNPFELEKSIRAKRLPIKFCYPGEGGDKWDKLRQEKTYHLGEREYGAFTRALEQFGLKSNSNIIHVGVGNGIELETFTEFETAKGVNYFGIDISSQMIANTIRYHSSQLDEFQHTVFLVTDVEQENNLEDACSYARHHGYNRNNLFITGQGVLCSNDDFLRYVSTSLCLGDSALFTFEKDNPRNRQRLLDTYNLKSVQQLLNIGLQEARIRNGTFLPAIFNECKQQVEIWHESEKEGRILCLSSYKPASQEQVVQRLTDCGLTVREILDFSDLEHYACFCEGVC